VHPEVQLSLWAQLVAIPPKYSVARVFGYMKRKIAIPIARKYMGKRRNYVGQNVWAGGYFVSTAGRDEAAMREYKENKNMKMSSWINCKCCNNNCHFR
jgi:putative transposase